MNGGNVVGRGESPTLISCLRRKKPWLVYTSPFYTASGSVNTPLGSALHHFQSVLLICPHQTVDTVFHMILLALHRKCRYHAIIITDVHSIKGVLQMPSTPKCSGEGEMQDSYKKQRHLWQVASHHLSQSHAQQTTHDIINYQNTG